MFVNNNLLLTQHGAIRADCVFDGVSTHNVMLEVVQLMKRLFSLLLDRNEVVVNEDP